MGRPKAKKVVKANIGTIYSNDFEKSLGELKEFVNKLIEKHGVDAYLDYDQHDPYSDDYSFRIRIERPETEEEYKIRVEKEYAVQENIEKRERALLEELQKKYIKKSVN